MVQSSVMKPSRKSEPSSRPRWIRQGRLPSLAELSWLQSAEGRRICQEMANDAPADTPAAITHWRDRLEPAQVTAAWNQVTLRRAARAKFSRADEMLFDRVGLEQATDEIVADHKAKRFAGLSEVVDFCCGIGGDALALARVVHVTAVDWSDVRIALARHNASVYGREITGITNDVAFIRPDAEAIHVDPDRRPTGPRRHQPDAGSPGLDVLEQIVRHYTHTAIKLSPGADFEALPFASEIELVSHAGECKQAIAWTGRFQTCHRKATVLPGGESISANAGESLDWPEPGTIQSDGLLFEPDPAVIRANLVGILARQHNLAPIDPQIAYLLGTHPVSTSMLSVFRIIEHVEFSGKRTRQLLARHDVGRVDIKTRGFAARPDVIQHQLHPKGKHHATLFLTRIADQPIAILAKRLTTANIT